MSTRPHTFYRLLLTFSFIYLLLSSTFISASKNGPVLQDTTEEVADVQPNDEEVEDWIQVGDLEGPSPSTKDLISEHFKGMLEGRKFQEIAEFGDIVGKDKLSDRASDVVQDFLVHSDTNPVREIIVRIGTIEGFEQHINDDSVSKALVISFNQDRHDRIVDLMNAMDIRYSVVTTSIRIVGKSLEKFLYDFFKKLAPEKDSAPLRRFLTFYTEEFRTRYSAIFETFCRMLVKHLKNTLPNPTSGKLLTDLIGQSHLLTSAAFISGFLVSSYVCDTDLTEFVKFAWREPMSEALNTHRWKTQILSKAVSFHGIPYEPPRKGQTDLQIYAQNKRTLAAILEHFKTKQEIEDEWNKKNASIIFKTIEKLISLPEATLIHISEYAVSLAGV